MTDAKQIDTLEAQIIRLTHERDVAIRTALQMVTLAVQQEQRIDQLTRDYRAVQRAAEYAQRRLMEIPHAD